MMRKRRLIVCDYDNPKGYTFPSFGFGSSEKRVWHFARTTSEIGEFEVVITGPGWLPEHVPKAIHFPKRLDLNTCDEFLRKFGKFDFLFAGHEYFDKDDWVVPFERCAETLISYQLHPYDYEKVSFDGVKKILFCYSDQMLRRYHEQKPRKALLFHSGVGEEPRFEEKAGDYLLWMGRFDKDKAPHFAVQAANQTGLPLWMLGKPVYQPDYFVANEALFRSGHVKTLGVKFGREKMDIIANALCVIYTIDRDYSEAGAGVLGEALSCGVPIAGMTWTGDDAVCEAVDDDRLGMIVNAGRLSDAEIPSKLAQAIKRCLYLDRKQVYQIGSAKYDPHALVRSLFLTIDQAQQSLQQA